MQIRLLDLHFLPMTMVDVFRDYGWVLNGNDVNLDMDTDDVKQCVNGL